MPDPISIVGLASLLTTCIDCFNYVQLARNFGKDYEICQIQLDCTELRLSRWGEAVGINAAGDQRHSRYQLLTAKDEDCRTIDNLLRAIIGTFHEAQKRSEKYKVKKRIPKANLDALAVYETADLNPAFQALHAASRNISARRWRRTSITSRAKWALYERDRFTTLVTQVTDLVDSLEKLFPAAEESQRQLSLKEVDELCRRLAEVDVAEPARREALKTLQEAAANDELLISELRKVEKASENGYLIRNMSHDGNALTVYGDRYADEWKRKAGMDGRNYNISGGKHGEHSITVYGNQFGT